MKDLILSILSEADDPAKPKPIGRGRNNTKFVRDLPTFVSDEEIAAEASRRGITISDDLKDPERMKIRLTLAQRKRRGLFNT